MRRFPSPWTVEKIPGGFKVIDSTGQSLAYVYGHADSGGILEKLQGSYWTGGIAALILS
jgi:hypothetical protein